MISIDEKMIIIFSFIFINIIFIAMFYMMNSYFFQNEFERNNTINTTAFGTLNPFAIALIFKFGLKTEKTSWKKQFQFRTFDIVIMGFFVALYLLLDFIGSFIPAMPFFVSISLKLIPLFYFSFIANFAQALIVCFIAGFLSYFMPNNADVGVSFIAYLFDYFFPALFVSIAALLQPKLKEEKNFKYVRNISFQWFCFISVPLILGYFSKVMSGVLFWFDASWGWNKWAYSLIFNLFNFAFDMTFCLIIIPIICTTTKVLKEKYYR
jgi:thiamine transporter